MKISGINITYHKWVFLGCWKWNWCAHRQTGRVSLQFLGPRQNRKRNTEVLSTKEIGPDALFCGHMGFKKVYQKERFIWYWGSMVRTSIKTGESFDWVLENWGCSFLTVPSHSFLVTNISESQLFHFKNGNTNTYLTYFSLLSKCSCFLSETLLGSLFLPRWIGYRRPKHTNPGMYLAYTDRSQNPTFGTDSTLKWHCSLWPVPEFFSQTSGHAKWDWPFIVYSPLSANERVSGTTVAGLLSHESPIWCKLLQS